MYVRSYVTMHNLLKYNCTCIHICIYACTYISLQHVHSYVEYTVAIYHVASEENFLEIF